jgi:hypothetical protein
MNMIQCIDVVDPFPRAVNHYRSHSVNRLVRSVCITTLKIFQIKHTQTALRQTGGLRSREHLSSCNPVDSHTQIIFPRMNIDEFMKIKELFKYNKLGRNRNQTIIKECSKKCSNRSNRETGEHPSMRIEAHDGESRNTSG